jgi:6-phosphogluconolactonase
MREVKIYQSPEAVATAAADLTVSLASSAIKDRGRFSMALSGGSTPRLLFSLLASPAYRDRIDWSKVFLFWGDERCVPPDHADSNYKMARETLLEKVPILEDHIHRMRGEDKPEVAAAAYEQTLRLFFNNQDPVFDLILLGMGDDGHTASLFPNSDTLKETKKWVISTHVEKVGQDRITFTRGTINCARVVAFLVTGEGKSERLEQVINGAFKPQEQPAQYISPDKGQVLWLVDTAAAGEFSHIR